MTNGTAPYSRLETLASGRAPTYALAIGRWFLPRSGNRFIVDVALGWQLRNSGRIRISEKISSSGSKDTVGSFPFRTRHHFCFRPAVA